MEYANAAITIGGKIKRADLDKLVDAIVDDGASLDWSGGLDETEALALIEGAAKEKTALHLCNNEQAWGQYEAIQSVCRELGLVYKAECEAGGEWHPHLEFYDPARQTHESSQTGNPICQEWSITEIGKGPMLDAEDIQKQLDASTLADEIALMTTVHTFPWPLEIVDNPEHEAERQQLLTELAEIDASAGGISNGPADIFADRRRAIENRLDELGPKPPRPCVHFPQADGVCLVCNPHLSRG